MALLWNQNEYNQKNNRRDPGKAVQKATPSNTARITPTNALYIGTSGTLVFLPANNGTPLFPQGPQSIPVFAGQMLSISASMILASQVFGSQEDSTDVDVWLVY